jgi:hypothetical protein
MPGLGIGRPRYFIIRLTRNNTAPAVAICDTCASEAVYWAQVGSAISTIPPANRQSHELRERLNITSILCKSRLDRIWQTTGGNYRALGGVRQRPTRRS